MLEKAMDKMDDRDLKVAEQTVINAFKTCDLYHNKVFVKGALLSSVGIPTAL